ncbi:MAG: tagaturonate epimerase family protein [Oscillospiraceae bacterium]|jgi:hypothetical protein|nr:tagaturonate epimerase family protein [Oscillospiraceae bacterium]
MSSELFSIYPNSIQKHNNSQIKMVKTDEGDALYVSGSLSELFDGEIMAEATQGCDYKLFKCTLANSKIIMDLFDFTRPKSHKGQNTTIGLGDRLGLASVGHIRLIRDLDIFPVLAQQSMRELNLTDRTYKDVLASAVWAVFREGYTKGYGADGDHLKNHDEVKYALSCGFSMITLDCSEFIRNDITNAKISTVEALYKELPADVRQDLEDRYLNKSFTIDCDTAIKYNKDDLKRIVLIYLPAIKHTLNIWNDLIQNTDVDFEVSIDETLTATKPESHFFVANELTRQGVEIRSLAPRFVGEFQKGIDYKGNVKEFEQDFLIHAKIANLFGYKISVHSGSDKFSVFPIINKLTDNRYHLKTAGTNWLEAVRVIAMKNPELYQEIHRFALNNLDKALAYYHITPDLLKIKELNDTPDSELPLFLDEANARQVLHITYGLILQEKSADGSFLFRDRLYKTLEDYEAEYIKALEKHIGLHLSSLGQFVE